MVRLFESPQANRYGIEAASEASAAIDNFISEIESSEEFLQANLLGASSSKVQELLTPTLRQLGFESERRAKSLSAEYRPDFTKYLDQTAILVEIERGKTLDNNMDMLDLWKTHVHPLANHLILIVPIWYQTSKSARSTFHSVCRRMEPFFVPGNFTNVHSLHVIGY